MGIVDRMELYETNDRIREYVDKYMKHHGITEVESALECIAVKHFIEYAEGDGR